MSRPLLYALLLLPPVLLPSGGASAHAILLDSQPAARGVAAPGPARITLRFNSRIDRARSRLVMRAPRQEAGREQVLSLSPTGADDVLESQADLQPGEWVLRWQVLAVDGHITRGDVPFQVGAPQAGASQDGAQRVRAPQVKAP